MDFLHVIIFWICVVTSIAVGSLLIYSLVMQRKSANSQSTRFQKCAAIEMGWIIVPFIILIILAAPAVKLFISQAT